MRAGRRNIKPGNQFNHLFNKPTQKDPYVGDFNVYGTLDKMQEMVGLYNDQVAKFTEHLKYKMIGSWTKKIGPMTSEFHIKEASKHIWNFLYHHVQYKIDTPGIEQLRTPNRLWADRVSGVDCDCYSIFISCVLTRLNINHSLRITAYDGKPNFQHVYVVVPVDGKKATDKRANYIVIDPVLDQFNAEKEFTRKHDKIMKHQVLNGIGTAFSLPSFGNEFSTISGVNGLGSIASEMEEMTRTHLQNTFNLMAVNPTMYEPYFNVPVFMEQIAYVLENWDDPYARQYALEELEEMEMAGEMAPFGGESSGVDGFWDIFNRKSKPKMKNVTSGSSNRNSQSKVKNVTSNARTKVQALRERRKVQPRVVPGTKSRGVIQKIPALRSIQKKIDPQIAEIKYRIAQSGPVTASALPSRQMQRNPSKSNSSEMTCICNPTLAGLSGNLAGGFWNKVKNGINKVKDKVKNTVTNVKTKVNNTVDKVKEKVKTTVDKVKEVGGNILKNNPVSWGIRKGMLGAFKVNLFKMSSRLAPAILSSGSARSAGYDSGELAALKKVLTSVEGMIQKVGGSKSELHAAIQAGKNRFDSRHPVNGLGVVATTAAAVTAAGPAVGLVAKITGFLKKINFKKLFARVKGIASGIKDKIGDNRDIPNEADIPKIPQMDPKDVPLSFDTNSPTLPYVNREVDPNLPVIDSQPPNEDFSTGLVDKPGSQDNDASGKGSNTNKIIIGAVLAGGILFGASKMMKSKSKGVGGVEVEV